MQKIIPHLWFDKEAKEAAEFYTRVFPHSKINHVSTIHDTPSGDCDIVGFELMGYSFAAISAGPYFKLNPSISFMVNFDPSQDPAAQSNIDELWAKLIEGGKALMPLDKYPFSERYGWVEDKYGVTWQLTLTNPAGEKRPAIVPSMLFTGKAAGKAKEASDIYISLFKNAKRGTIVPNFTDFMLEGQWFAAIDSPPVHTFAFNEAISLIVKCDSQEEIDHYWKLSADPQSEQCGWLKDAYGVSWQITPTRMDELMESGTDEQKSRVTQAFLKMKKFNIAKLEEAYRG